MAERRQYPRVKASASAVVVHLRYASDDAPEESRILFCETTDLSVQGVRLTLDRSLPKGTAVLITLVFREPAQHVEHTGVVRWSRAHEAAGAFTIGIEFTARTGAGLQAWTDFLEATFPQISLRLEDADPVL